MFERFDGYRLSYVELYDGCRVSHVVSPRDSMERIGVRTQETQLSFLALSAAIFRLFSLRTYLDLLMASQIFFAL